MCDMLDECCGDFMTYVRPQGGLFIWVRLDERINMPNYVSRLVEQKVAVVPGTAFMVDDIKPCHYVRLNFSTPSDDDIIKGVKIMGEIAKEFI